MSFGLIVCPEIERLPILQALASYQEFFATGDGATPRAKRYDLDAFREFLALIGKAQAQTIEITHEDVVEFREHRLRLEAPATVDRRLKTIRHVFNTLAKRHPGYLPPTAGVKAPVVRRLAPERLSVLELRQMTQKVDELFQDAEKQLRARVMLHLGRFEGLRLEEIRSVTVGQYCPLTQTLRDVRRKGARFQTFALHEVSNGAILNYLPEREKALEEVRGYRGLHDKGVFPLLISTHGAKVRDPESFRIGHKTIYRTVRSLGERIEIHAHPHRLRHTCCHELLDASGNDIFHVADLMGHANVNTTRGYRRRGLEDDRELQRRRTV